MTDLIIVNNRDRCRLCECNDLERVFQLTPTPPANAFVPPKKLSIVQKCFPLDVYQCVNCSHVQLLIVIDPEYLFQDYVYVSGTSPVFVKHFKEYAESIVSYFGIPKDSFIVDIGSNDGTLLKFFQDYGMRVLGIDPAIEIAKKATEEGIETLPLFFGNELACNIRDERGPATVIAANNVFAHSDNLIGFAQAVRELLAWDGVFVFEVSYLVDVYERVLFDMTYHEHLSYHLVHPLQSFFETQGLQLIESIRVDTHGGSLRGIVQLAGGPRKVGKSVSDLVRLESKLELDKPETLKLFGNRIDELGKKLQKLIRDLKSNGKSIAGYGAPAKATTLMYHFGLGPDILDFIVDDSPLKQGLYSPGLHIPVLPSSALYEKNPDYVLILAWNFADFIMNNNLAYSKAGGKFIIPLPTIQER